MAKVLRKRSKGREKELLAHTITLRVATSMLEELEALAAEEERKLGDTVRRVLRRGLESIAAARRGRRSMR